MPENNDGGQRVCCVQCCTGRGRLTHICTRRKTVKTQNSVTVCAWPRKRNFLPFPNSPKQHYDARARSLSESVRARVFPRPACAFYGAAGLKLPCQERTIPVGGMDSALFWHLVRAESRLSARWAFLCKCFKLLLRNLISWFSFHFNFVTNQNKKLAKAYRRHILYIINTFPQTF